MTSFSKVREYVHKYATEEALKQLDQGQASESDSSDGSESSMSDFSEDEAQDMEL